MRLKLDENLEGAEARHLRARGVDADTVRREGLGGRQDSDIYRACLQLKRTLITLDMGFANPLRFPPGPTRGIVVLRPRRPVFALVRILLDQAIRHLEANSPVGLLWIVEAGRVREFTPRSGRK